MRQPTSVHTDRQSVEVSHLRFASIRAVIYGALIEVSYNTVASLYICSSSNSVAS